MPLILKSIKLHENTVDKINEVAKISGVSFSDACRELIEKGLKIKMGEDNIDEIATIIRQQLNIVLKPHIERLAALSAKGGIMSATSAYLNAQAIMDLAPEHRRREARELFDKAKVKGVTYIKEKLEE